jgi:hypothetical protein
LRNNRDVVSCCGVTARAVASVVRVGGIGRVLAGASLVEVDLDWNVISAIALKI